ncbi:MAG: saccharopine dehydrogenase NADP-binding domain-containing protein [Anaerolineales bacterium]|nr:saccharopine dehydrogenase NADP-binding domain-containing protein [Anaerolineales bacterium]
MKTFIIYGSYGYTGQLIAELAVKEGLKPILAGRDETQLKTQAQRLGLEYRAFDLADTAALDSALQEVEAVLHCAGPFVLTFRQMAEACLRNKKHYVDISGEIEGFEALAALDNQAKQAGIMLLPGAGFDVVPTDCLSAHLKQRLPSATHLRLFIRGVGAGVSRGTAKSAIENMHRQGRIRRDGEIVQVPAAWKVVQKDFGRGSVSTVTVGWGDVSTAYYSTGIPNIETYMAFPQRIIKFMRASQLLGFVLYSRPVKNILKFAVNNLFPPGPSEERRNKGVTIIIGEVTDAKGGRTVSRLQTREGYSFTAQATVEIMKRILSSDYKTGFQTPSLVYGSDFVIQFDGTKRTDE